jgi:ABC-type lipoprotein release transport system permease subunit
MAGPNLPKLAWRNVWRNRRRTLLTLSSIAFGTLCAVLFTAIGDANWASMIELAARMGGGHVSVQHPEYLDTQTLTRTIVAGPELQKRLLADPAVEALVPRISGHMMVATAGQSYGAAFLAVDPARESLATLSLLEAIEEGQMFESADDEGIILGAKLAENLRAKLRSKVVYTATDKSGEIIYGVARVTGIVRTGAPSVDASLTLMPLDTMRGVLGYGPRESITLALFLRDQRSAKSVSERIAATLPRAAVAVPWYETQAELASFIAMKVAGARFMEAIILLLVAAGIFNTLFVSVMERLREFGVLLAIGLEPASLFWMVMWESFWLAIVGLVAAAFVTAGPYWYMATKGIDLSAMVAAETSEVAGVAVSMVMKAGIYQENLIMIVFAVVSATLLSGIYPAWRAARIEPADAIRLV